MVARLIIILTLFIVALYDVCAMITGRITISQQIRVIDAQLNGLVRWGWLALWCHFFIRSWRGPTGL